MSVTCKIQEYNALQKRINKVGKVSETVVKRTMSDASKRVPGWIAQEVPKHYGIKKAEITSGKVGSIKVHGDDLGTLKIIYKGRVLTPTHFSMSPKEPGKNAYTLKYRVVDQTKSKVKKLTKKQRKALAKNLRGEGTRSSDHSPIMLMRTGGTYIPFQRKSTNRKDIQAIKTVSLPQMVSSDGTTLKPEIANEVWPKLDKRLDHHLKLLDKV